MAMKYEMCSSINQNENQRKADNKAMNEMAENAGEKLMKANNESGQSVAAMAAGESEAKIMKAINGVA